MIFSRSAMEAVVSAWNADQAEPRRRRTPRDLPQIDALGRLIDIAFVASLKRVEERPTRFGLAVLPRDVTARGSLLQGRRSEILLLESSPTLTADTLARLAAGCDPSLGSLLVDVAGDGSDDWVIWGCAFYEPSGVGFAGSGQRGMPASLGLDAMRPDVLMISTSAPGSLDIARGDSRIGQFAMGQFVPALPTPLSMRGMGALVGTRVSEAGVAQGDSDWYVAFYLRWLEYLLAETAKRGHGGSIVFCPSSAWAAIRALCQGGQRLSGDLSLGQVIAARYRQEQELRKATGMEGLESGLIGIAKCEEHLLHRLSYVGQLASCDGALIIGEHFRPIAYGTMLPAIDWTGETRAGLDGFGHGGEPYSLLQHGMRHRSAACFVASHASLFGFVISQDGPIRGFALGRDGVLLVWRDCRASMFV